MADFPMLFQGSMVRGMLREIEAPGTGKTNTRRLFKGIEQQSNGNWHIFGGMVDVAAEDVSKLAPDYVRIRPGDRLWVRESWWIATMYSYGATAGGCEISPPPLAWRKSDPVHYAADGNPPNVGNRTYGPDGLRGGAFAAPDPYAVWLRKPSIHMPRWTSRITLLVTEVKVERLQDISREDAIAEGLEWVAPTWGIPGIASTWHGDPRESYFALWDHINGAGAAAKNPWVVAYVFTPTLQNIDRIAA